MDQTLAQIKTQAYVGTGLMTTPLWVLILQDISLVAGAIAAVCGAILGISAVLKLRRRP